MLFISDKSLILQVDIKPDLDSFKILMLSKLLSSHDICLRIVYMETIKFKIMIMLSIQ